MIQASLLLQKMDRAPLDSIPENAVFSRIPMQINGSGSQWNSEKSEHVLPWMVTKEPLLVSQTPLNAVRVGGLWWLWEECADAANGGGCV